MRWWRMGVRVSGRSQQWRLDRMLRVGAGGAERRNRVAEFTGQLDDIEGLLPLM